MPTTTKRRTSATKRELQMLRNLVVNHHMMDTDFRPLRQQPITESLKHLQQAWMESEWPGICTPDQRACINEHFWMVYETAEHLQKLRTEPHELKSRLMMTIEGLMIKQKEVAK